MYALKRFVGLNIYKLKEKEKKEKAADRLKE